jgi:soluble lytic murein transglycosylase-like protein
MVPKLDPIKGLARRLAPSLGRPVQVFLRDVGHGMLEVCHNSLALIGLAVVAVVLFFASRDDVRHGVEVQAMSWLQARHEAATPEALAEPLLVVDTDMAAVSRATAIDPTELDRQQAAVANWLARRYRVAPEPVSRLVQEAWQVGQRARIEPTLILAIIAIESSFNPFAQSAMGAQGLMQVMTRVHDDKYEAFGGNHAAFDPVTNLRVGVQVLRECIARAGSVEAGLRYYVGAANLSDDGGYAGKVLAEQAHLRSVAAGRRVAVNAPNSVPPAPAPATVSQLETSDQQIALR